jgi:hypothetical protein
MVQTAGFDPSLIPAGPSEGRRQPDPDPDSARVTPVDESDGLQAERRQPDPTESRLVDPPTRVAFTAKFGPDSDGFPLQIVRGDDLVGAENIDVEVITARRLSSADREVLLRAQEEQSTVVEAEQQQQATVETEQRQRTAVEVEQAETTVRTEESQADSEAGSTLDLEV